MLRSALMSPTDLNIVIIDDDSWIRRGRAVAIDETSGYSVVAAFSPTDALAHTDPDWWKTVDVVLADAHDEDAGFDKFIGVRVVAHIRNITGRARPHILVITGHLYNDLLRLRMAEAGADFFYSHADVRTPEALVGAINASQYPNTQSSRSSTESLSSSGRSASTKSESRLTGLNSAVSWAEANLGEGAFQNESQKALPVSRRSIITARQRLGQQLPTSDGRTVPSWREISQFIDRARGKERRGQ